jgi:hypothetical protein
VLTGLWGIGGTLTNAQGRRDAIVLVWVGAASLAATLLNPYGFGLWRFLFETVGVTAIAVNVACISIDARNASEADAVSVLKNATDGNRLLVWFDWGEYAIWHLSPAMRVSIDGRRETVYSASVQNRHVQFFFDGPGASDLPREIGADYVWIPAWLPATRRLRATEWTVLLDGPTSAPGRGCLDGRRRPGGHCESLSPVRTDPGYVPHLTRIHLTRSG